MAISKPGAAAASAAAAASSDRIESRLLQPMPQELYQTFIVDGKQDSSTPYETRIQLSPAAFFRLCAAPLLRNFISVRLMRFDGQPVVMYDSESESMQVVRLSKDMFAFELDHAAQQLMVQIHRKHLPVSSAHSDAPFRMAFVLPGAEGVEIVATNAFLIGSKQPRATVPKAAPKRLRAPSSRLPFTAPPDELDAMVVAALRGGSLTPPKVGGMKRTRSNTSLGGTSAGSEDARGDAESVTSEHSVGLVDPAAPAAGPVAPLTPPQSKRARTVDSVVLPAAADGLVGTASPLATLEAAVSQLPAPPVLAGSAGAGAFLPPPPLQLQASDDSVLADLRLPMLHSPGALGAALPAPPSLGPDGGLSWGSATAGIPTANSPSQFFM